MAPVLRKRKEKPAAEVAVATKKAKTSKVEKRKAPEEASPVPVKKQKSVKTATPASEKKTKKEEEDVKPVKEKKTSKKSKAQEVVEDEEPVKEEAVVPADDSEAEAEAEEDEDAREVDEQTQALVSAFDSEDEDAPEEAEGAYKKGQDVGKIPKTAKKLPKKKETPSDPKDRGVIYLGRIPHGFAEREMRSYFSQFGEVTRLRLARNKKTGQSKHFAFIEFADKEVAEIVAQTMDRYLLFGHILRCRICPSDQVHPDLFKGANRRFKKVPWNKMAGRHLEKPAGESTWQTRILKEQKRRSARAEKLKELMDYEYDSPALKEAKAKEPALENGAEEETPKAIEAPPAPEQVQAEKATEESVVEEEKAPATEETADKPKKAKSSKKVTKAKKAKS